MQFNKITNDRMDELEPILHGLKFEHQYIVMKALCLNMELMKHPVVHRWCVDNARRIAHPGKGRR